MRCKYLPSAYPPIHTVVDGMQSKKIKQKIFCEMTRLGVALTFQLFFLNFEKRVARTNGDLTKHVSGIAL